MLREELLFSGTFTLLLWDLRISFFITKNILLSSSTRPISSTSQSRKLGSKKLNREEIMLEKILINE